MFNTDIYENQVIGCFMALLFREHGIRHGRMPFEPFGVQLLQQTPEDRCLGDLLISQAKLVRLIEFKRKQNKSRKEREKLAVLRPALQGVENTHLVAISRDVHWYVETDFKIEASSTVVPYLDLENPSGERDLNRFIEEIGEAMVGPGMTDRQLQSLRIYMQALAVCAGESESRKSSGALIIATGNDGRTRYFAVSDLRELAMSPQKVFREHSLRIDRAKELERTQHLMRGQDQDFRPQRGLDLGL
jgi:hypothetical protein